MFEDILVKIKHAVINTLKPLNIQIYFNRFIEVKRFYETVRWKFYDHGTNREKFTG